MSRTKYQRTLSELENSASKWWPEFLQIEVKNNSIIPILLKSQDQFISILTLTDYDNPLSVFQIIESCSFAANLFLKHLMVLTDFGSEPMQRINSDFKEFLFPDGKIEFKLGNKVHEYKFSEMPKKGTLTNNAMGADFEGLKVNKILDGFYKDLIVLLLYGKYSTNPLIEQVFSKCEVGGLLHNSEELKKYIKQRYIYVSRITGGATANDLGNFAQYYVLNYLSEKLGSEYITKNNGSIPGVSHNGNKTETTFDVVVQKESKYVGIELSFQVTTNSTIERKSREAETVYKCVKGKKCYLAYIVDGAGNFQRKAALNTICDNSDCTIAYSNSEFDLLIEFIKSTL